MKTILIGGGGHAISLLETLSDYKQIAGYADMQPSRDMPIPYLGADADVLATYTPQEYDIQVTLVYTSEVNLQLRKCVIERYKNYHSHTFVASTALVTRNSNLGEGCVVMEKAVVNRSSIGKNTVINTGAIIEHNCTIGNNCFIGPGAVLCGGVTVGDNTFIGAGTVVRDDVSIASDCTVGMGSLVTKDIIEAGVYRGQPAKSRKI
ncbi:MAG: NeuD/PglB/VioB family sugar acetyltransferase [Bacteroidaceae bacterium]|nr:NeuD/PglB/VioB family sugar acetyltransferase [Bacteroidaceae bacterium]